MFINSSILSSSYTINQLSLTIFAIVRLDVCTYVSFYIIISLLEVIIETEHQVVAVEVETPVFSCTVVLGGTVAALISEKSYVCDQAEFLADIV